MFEIDNDAISALLSMVFVELTDLNFFIVSVKNFLDKLTDRFDHSTTLSGLMSALYELNYVKPYMDIITRKESVGALETLRMYEAKMQKRLELSAMKPVFDIMGEIQVIFVL